MLTLDEAQTAIVKAVQMATDSEPLTIAEANGRYLAQSATTVCSNPAFDNSAMDGYAVNIKQLAAQNFLLNVNGESSCGDTPSGLVENTTMRIFTGAPIPEGADAVVIQEDIKIIENNNNESDGDKIQFPRSVQPDQNIRHCGDDFKKGKKLFEIGHRLTAADLALLSAAGVAEVLVWRRARALVIATGSELVAPGENLAPGQIYESNRLATIIMLRELGVDVTDGGMVVDNIDAVRDVLTGAKDYDFVVTSGGVSVGDHDLVKKVFSEIGEINFWKVKIKPGKPVAFGRLGDKSHFIGLPGNPVSSLVTFKLFLEPAIAAWHHQSYRRPEFAAQLESDYSRHAGRTEFLRARLSTDSTGQIHAEVLQGQGSHMLGTLEQANGLLRVDADSSEINKGDTVQVVLLRQHLPAWD